MILANYSASVAAISRATSWHYDNARMRAVPEISRFLGIVIAMYYRDHAPPHFHAIYGEYEATINIATGMVSGKIPMRAMSHIQEWRELHRQELLDAWELARSRKPLPNIAPLE